MNLWAWLPDSCSLASGAPDEGELWTREQGFESVDLGREGLTFEELAQRAAPEQAVLTVVDRDRAGWIPALANRIRGRLVVFGPRSCARESFRNGVPEDAPPDELALSTEYTGPPLPSPDAEGWARLHREEALRAGYDPALCALDPLPTPSPPASRGIAFEGIDGSGKSTQAARAAEVFASRGLASRVERSCRTGEFYEHISRLLARTVLRDEPRGWRLGRLVKAFDSVRIAWEVHESLGNGECVVWDRYLETHLAAARMRFGDDAGIAELIDSAPRLPRCFLLDLDPSSARGRVDERGGLPTLDEHETALRRYALAFRSQARVGRLQRLDGTGTPDEIGAAVDASIDEAIA